MTIKQKYILGVDAGGTKTATGIADIDGKVLAVVKGGAGSFNAGSSYIQAFKNIKLSVIDALKKAKLSKIKFASIYIGVAGVDSPKDREIATLGLRKVLKPYIGKLFKVRGDITLIHRSESKDAYGIGLVAGTGTNCYGKNMQGEEAYSAGMGHIMADEGGGYWIGREMLRAGLRSYDSRGPKTKIEPLLKKYFKVKDFRDISRDIYHRGWGKKEIASIATLIDNIDPKKDEVVKSILDLAGYELVLNVLAVSKKLKMRDSTFDLVGAGSILTKKNYIKKFFKREIKRYLPYVNIIISDKEPVIGALFHAKDQL